MRAVEPSSRLSVMQAGRDIRIIHQRGPRPWSRAGATALWGGTAVVGGLALLYRWPLVPAVLAWVTASVAVTAGAVGESLRARGKRVFLVTSACRQKYWLAGLMHNLQSVLDRNGLDMVLKTPDRDYDTAAQAHHLRRLVQSRRGYAGGFVVASDARRMRTELVEFCAEVRVPIVFVDVDPFDDAAPYPSNAAFVGYRSADLGTMAGHWLADHFARHRIRSPRVLIVAGQGLPERQGCCADVLRARVSGVSILVDDSCAFQRTRAQKAVQTHVLELETRKGRLDAVFCTNDEMALGAVDALHAADSPRTKHTVVVGIDGIPEAVALIDSGISPLRATVVQDSHLLAESAIHVLTRLRRGQTVAPRTVLRPELHQAARSRENRPSG